jgi:hypothetical protein
MRHSRSSAILAVTVVGITLMMCAGASAREVQLAGIRLGDHAIHLLDIYGQPDGIVTGVGEELAAAQAPMMMEGAGPAMMGPPDGGMGLFGDMLGAFGGMPPGGPLGPDIAGGPDEMGPGGFPGEGEMPGAGGVGGAGGTQPFPMWALPVWVTLEAHDVEWIYQKGPVVLGFVLDRDGFVKVIAVAAEDCNYARTALWKPHRYVKLGDSYQRVLYRYGFPDEQLSFSWNSPGSASVGGGTISVSFGQTSRTFSRDAILRYHESSNIAFTLHNFKVTRIHIWE